MNNFFTYIQVRDIDFEIGKSSGGRLLSQTLDESQFVVDFTVAYDLIANTMTNNERMIIEYNLFRSMVILI